MAGFGISRSQSKERIKETKVPVRLKVNEWEKDSIDKLVEKLDYGQKKYLLLNLSQFVERRMDSRKARLAERIRPYKDYRYFSFLEKEIFSEGDRFSITRERDPTKQFYTIFKKALKIDDALYLQHLLRSSLKDVYVTDRIKDLFKKLYTYHIKQEYAVEKDVPKVPLVLVIGDTRSGKTETIKAAIEEVIFENDYVVESNLENEKKTLVENHPVKGRAALTFPLRYVPYFKNLDPELNSELIERDKEALLNGVTKVPIFNRLVKKVFKKYLVNDLYRGIIIDVGTISPQNVKTKWYGEGGHDFQQAYYPSTDIGIRIIEEAHAVIEEPTQAFGGTDSQQETVRTAVTQALDEVIEGKKKIITIALTHSPDKIARDIYNRFFQFGTIISMNEEWHNAKNPEYCNKNLKELIKLELLNPSKPTSPSLKLDDSDLDNIVRKIPDVFKERGGLTISPGFIKKFISYIVEKKGDFKSEYLEDRFLIRESFKDVARNSFGTEFYNKIVGKIKREPWDSYVGRVKEDFAKKARSTLYYNSDSKGIILSGPPGSGKTFLAQCFLSEHPEIEDVSVNPSIILEGDGSIAKALENLDKVFLISKMLSPTFLYIDEIDSLVPTRQGNNPADKIVNKFLNEIGGENPFLGVYVTGSTNRLENVDPALVRAMRLDVLSVNGNLTEKNIKSIIDKELKNYSKRNLDTNSIYNNCKDMCHTPAEFIKFLREIRELRDIEYKIMKEFKNIYEGQDFEQLERFFRLNKKYIDGIMANLNISIDSRYSSNNVYDIKDLLYSNISTLVSLGRYPITLSHLERARSEYLQHPMRKGFSILEEFLSGELSMEPQTGFVLGMAASSDERGLFTPIATNLEYKTYQEKFIITGMVSPGMAAPELEAATKMAEQSAKEAYATTLNYLDTIASKDNVDVYKLIGDYLDGWSFHHQFLNPQYQGGGPSAGYALTINTLSVILDLDVFNDFAITGAPWSKGPKKEDVGSPIIIGGEESKTYKALQSVRRMYLPPENLRSINEDYMENYWSQKKDVLAIKNMKSLVPEVFYFSDTQKDKLNELIDFRIGFKSRNFDYDFTRIETLEKELGEIAEREIRERMMKLKTKLEGGDSNKYLKLIF